MITITMQAETLQEIIANMRAALSDVGSLPQAEVKIDVSAPYVAPPAPPSPESYSPPVAAQPPTPVGVSTAYTPPTYSVPPAPAQTQPPVYAPPPQTPPLSPAPTQAPTYTEAELMRAAGMLMDSGKGPQLQQLLASMGAQYLGQVPKERYGEVALALKGMGARL